MKKLVLLSAVLFFALVAVGCTSVQAYDPGTSVPASDTYNVLGMVEAEVNVQSSLFGGLIRWGDSSVNAKKRLMSVAPAGTNDIINVSYEEVITDYFGFFRKTKYRLMGTAIQYY